MSDQLCIHCGKGASALCWDCYDEQGAKDLAAARARVADLEAALTAIRSHSNGAEKRAMEMQMMAAEALEPGRFQTPEHLLKRLKAGRE